MSISKSRMVMYPITVSGGDGEDVTITQEWNDINEANPEIQISQEQAAVVASWLIEAANRNKDFVASEETVPVSAFLGGPMAEPKELSVFTNASGMVVVKMDDDFVVEISPIMAKRLREHLSRAIADSLTEMLTGDDQI